MISYAVTQKLVLVAGVLLAVGTPAQAQQKPIPPKAEVVDATTYPWSAIGKLNNGIGASCTAVLISPSMALTAAHCLYFRNTARFLPTQTFHLIVGYENQQYQNHYRISAYYVPPSYDPLRPYKTLASDWALLSLARQGRPPIRTLDVSIIRKPEMTSTLMTAGYSHLTPYAMTADRNCTFIGNSYDGNFLFDSCIAPSGFSGSPVIVSNGDHHSYSIVGIHVANRTVPNHEIAIAIPIESIWREIAPCVRDGQCEFQFFETGKDPTAAEVLAGLPN